MTHLNSFFSKTFATATYNISKNKLCSIFQVAAIMILLLSIAAQSSYGQCQDVTQSSWVRSSTTSPAYKMYYEGATGITRMGKNTSPYARVPDAVFTDGYNAYDASVYQTATILPTASAKGTVNVPVGQSQTISAIYQAPQSVQAGVSWAMGWASSPTFAGGNANSVSGNASSAVWANNISVRMDASGNSYVDLYYYAVGSGTTYIAGLSSSTASLNLMAGDSISMTLIPRTGGTTDLQVVVYRPSTNTLLAQYTAQNVLLSTGSGAGLSKLYPTMEIISGAANIGCIKIANQTVKSPALPNSGTCSTGLVSPWKLNNNTKNYTIKNDGTQTVLWYTSTNTRSDPNTYNPDGTNDPSTGIGMSIVRQDSARIFAGDSSVVSATFLAPVLTNGVNNQRFTLGWVYKPTFTSSTSATPGYDATKSRWATYIYVYGSMLQYRSSSTGGIANLWGTDPSDGPLVAGDQIIGKLIPNTTTGGADLQVIVYRPSANAIVFEKYIPTDLTATEASYPLYAAVQPNTGGVNLSCVGAGISSLPSIGGTASANQAICYNSSPATLNVTGITGSVTKWQYSIDSFMTDTHDTAVTTSSLLPPKLTSTTYYRAVVKNGVSATANSSIVKITVNAPSAGGVVVSAQNVCQGTQPAAITVSNYTGSILNWQYSRKGDFSDAQMIATTNATLSFNQMLNTSDSGTYRAVVQNGACPSANSTPVLIGVSKPTQGGSAQSATTTICGGAQPSPLYLSGVTGKVKYWQYSTTNFSTADSVNIPSSMIDTLTGNLMGTLNANRQYRALVQNGTCPATYSGIININVNAAIGGKLSPNQVICSGSTPPNQLSIDNTLKGSVMYWQSSASGNFGADTVKIPVGGSSLSSGTMGILNSSNYYRAVVQYPGCPAIAYSTVDTIIVNAKTVAGTLAPSQSILKNTSPANIALSGNTGSVIKWQYSIDSFVSDIHDIAKTDSIYTSAQIGQLSASRYYRVIDQNGVCAAATTSIVSIKVMDLPSVGGTISTPQTICYNNAPATLVLSSFTGTVVKWQYSVDSFKTDKHDIAVTDTFLTSAQMGQLTTNTYYRAIVKNGTADSAYSSIVLMSIDTVDTWTGESGTDWNTTTNWACRYIPKITTNVYIPAGVPNYPLLNTTLAGLCHNLKIDSLASVTIVGADTLKISGTISNKGVLDAIKGAIELKGAEKLTIMGSMFAAHTINKLIINDTSVTIAGATTDTLKIVDVLSFGDINNANFNTGGHLELLSSATLTARVADITNNGRNFGNQIKGKAVVDRYIPAHRSWRLLTAPVSSSNTIFQAWQNNGVYDPGKGTLITMPSPVKNGLDAGINTNYSMNIFNTATQSFPNLSNTQVPISQGSSGSADNTGYMIFVRGDRTLATVANPNFGTPPTENTVLSSYGNLQTYDQVFQGVPTAGKYITVGNPYASPIDFGKIILNNIINRYYIWDANLNTVGGFVVFDGTDNNGTYDKSVLSSGQTTLLQSGQAFMVQTNITAPSSLTIKETAKAVGDNILVFRPAAPVPTEGLRLTLNTLDNNNNPIAAIDGALVKFDNSYSAAVDVMDAPKLGNMNEGLGLLRNTKSLSIERRPLIDVTDTVYLKLTSTTSKSYQLQLDASNLLQPGLSGRVVDKYLNSSTALDLTGTTLVNFSIVTGTASAATDRFMVVFNQNVPLPVTFTNVVAARQNNQVAVNWKVANELNVRSYIIERSVDGINFNTINTVSATGSTNYQWIDTGAASDVLYYRIKSVDKNGATTYSTIVKVNAVDAIPSITLPDNSNNANGLSFKFTNMPKGNYTVNLLGTNGQLIESKLVNYSGGTSSVVVNFSVAVSKGLNIAEVVCTDNTIQSFKVTTL